MDAEENKKPSQQKEGSRAPAGEPASEGPSSLKSVRSLRRLRDRVERAAHELRVLREENTSLQHRIAELEAASGKGAEQQKPFFESDPEVVKKKVEGFIEAIDRYLDETQ